MDEESNSEGGSAFHSDESLKTINEFKNLLRQLDDVEMIDLMLSYKKKLEN